MFKECQQKLLIFLHFSDSFQKKILLFQLKLLILSGPSYSFGNSSPNECLRFGLDNSLLQSGHLQGIIRHRSNLSLNIFKIFSKYFQNIFKIFSKLSDMELLFLYFCFDHTSPDVLWPAQPLLSICTCAVRSASAEIL